MYMFGTQGWPVGAMQPMQKKTVTMPKPLPPGEPTMEGITLVSLGHYCGPKLSFRSMGVSTATLPFDWIKTRLEGVLYYMQNNFAHFFHFVTREPVPTAAAAGIGMVMYRDYLHSFWHDDPTDPETVEKYKRRFQRFDAIDARSSPVLFVRGAVSTDELPLVPKLQQELRRFGNQAYLLLILDLQQGMNGLAEVMEHPQLLVYFNGRSSAAFNEARQAPYEEAIRAAVARLRGRIGPAKTFGSWSELCAAATPTGHYVRASPGGLKAFDDAPDGLLMSALKGMPCAQQAPPPAPAFQCLPMLPPASPLMLMQPGTPLVQGYCRPQAALTMGVPAMHYHSHGVRVHFGG